ncbi:unnamed protein product [Caenorhabditis brenneri]
MSFRLLRLPLVALREVIKSMDMRKLLLFPSLSKKCHQVVRASISKKSSLELTFTPEKDVTNVTIAPELILKMEWADQDPDHFFQFGDKLDLRVYFTTCNRCVKFEWTKTDQVTDDEELIRNMLDHFVDTINPMVSFNFNSEIRQEFAMELIRYCRRTSIRLFWIKFDYGDTASPEYVREILEGSIDELPPGGFKMAGLTVSDPHWVDLDDFLQFRVFDDSYLMTTNFIRK